MQQSFDYYVKLDTYFILVRIIVQSQYKDIYIGHIIQAKVDEKDVEEDDGKEEKKDDGEEKGAKKDLEEDAAVGKKDLDEVRENLLFQISLYDEGIEEIDDPNGTWELSTEYEYLSVYSKANFTEKDSFYGMKLVGTFDCSL